jgi:ferritin-like protein
MTQNAGLQECQDRISPEALDRHRAVLSIREEFDAIDLYDQRVEATDNPELAALLAHNRDEEKEHVAMLLEWLRRQDPALDSNLHTYLFTSGPVTEIEAEAEAVPPGEPDAAGGSGSLSIGSLKGESL